MRHGPAEGSAPSGRDFDRALSEAGRHITSSVARELLRRGEIPGRIFSSPLLRAVQTGEIVAAALGGSVEVLETLAPTEAAPDLAGALHSGSAERVLVVGHAPDVSFLVSSLVGRPPGGFEPAMVVAVDVAPTGLREVATGVERFVIRPSALA